MVVEIPPVPTPETAQSAVEGHLVHDKMILGYMGQHPPLNVYLLLVVLIQASQTLVCSPIVLRGLLPRVFHRTHLGCSSERNIGLYKFLW